MRVGLQIPVFTWPGYGKGQGWLHNKLAEIVQVAEECGFYSLWVMDHFFQLEGLGRADEPMLEAYSTLSFAAALTENIHLGTLVSGVIYRYPGVLVKTATTLDVLAGGRTYFGIGAAWYEREAKGLGVPFPPLKDRFEQLEETLQIAKKMWSGDTTSYNGKHYQLAEPICSPPPRSEPHPRIMIGGGGEQKTLRLVAQYGDACNLFARLGTETIRHKLDILKQHCDAVGRDYNEIERTALGTVQLAPGHMSAADAISVCRDLADAGIQHIIFNMPANLHEITPLNIFAREIIPAVAEF